MADSAPCLPRMDARERIVDLIPRLRRYARALTSPHAGPDELVRVVLLRATRQLRIGHAEADLRVWLFSLLHEAYVERAGGAESNGTEPSRPVPQGAQVLPFERAIATLPASQREIFLLVTLEDMSYEQVAQTLAIPIGTVMSRLSRAREKLRLLLMNQARLRAVK